MKIRATPVIDGVTCPDFYFDHPNFQGASFGMTLYVESSPGIIDKYTQAAGSITKTAGTNANNSPNDSRAASNYYV